MPITFLGAVMEEVVMIVHCLTKKLIYELHNLCGGVGVNERLARRWSAASSLSGRRCRLLGTPWLSWSTLEIFRAVGIYVITRLCKRRCGSQASAGTLIGPCFCPGSRPTTAYFNRIGTLSISWWPHTIFLINAATNAMNILLLIVRHMIVSISMCDSVCPFHLKWKV